MVTERNNFVNIREILSRCTRHPMLKSLDLEQVIQYTVDFISIVGMPTLYNDKVETIHIDNYRGLLPCDLVSIIQVKDKASNTCMRSMTDSFNPGLIADRSEFNYSQTERSESTFKTQGRVIFTSFRTGEISLSYRAIPVDKEGLPLLIDNANFLKALELYIKKQVFTVLFDLGKLQAGILQNTQQEYAWAVAQCEKEFIMPSMSEMESITRMWNTIIPNTTSFDKGFEDLGNREYIKVQ